MDDLSSESLLVTLDVISLYTNIPHQEGLDACRETLNKREVLDPPTENIVQLTSIILKKNTFFLQRSALFAETRNCDGYPNGPILRKYLYGQTWMWPFTSEEAKTDHLVEVYRDDIFAVWPQGWGELAGLFDELNSFHPTIKFTAEWSRESVTFLDTKVMCDGNCLVTDILYQANRHPSVPSPMKLSSRSLQIQHCLQPSTSGVKNLFQIHGLSTRGGTLKKIWSRGASVLGKKQVNREGHSEYRENNL